MINVDIPHRTTATERVARRFISLFAAVLVLATPLSARAQESAAGFPILRIQNVNIGAADGCDLAATLYSGRSEAPGLLLFHQFGTGQRWNLETDIAAWIGRAVSNR